MALERHGWPGNLRELRNVIERALMVCTGDVVGEDCILIDPPAASPEAERHPPRARAS